MSDEPSDCTSAQRYIRGIVYDSIERARISQNIYLSDRNRQLLLDAARDEASEHECLQYLQIPLPPKRMVESAGMRGATIAFICTFTALLLLLFMHPGLVRDAVVSALMVGGVLGSAVAWVGRRRATRRII